MRNVLAIASIVGLGMLSGCAGSADSSDVSDQEAKLVVVTPADLFALTEGQSFLVDLVQMDSVYEIDGTGGDLDIGRISVLEQGGAQSSLRDFMSTHHIYVDPHRFLIRLAGDPELALGTSSEVGVQSQALKKGEGHGIGGSNYTCSPLSCECHGYDDCIDMFRENGPCGGSSWCDSDNGNPTCGCTR